MFNWINKDSVSFLKNGYLVGNTTPIDRVKYIADYAENILKIEGFSDKFFNYMGRGWYSLSSPVWSNFGLERGLPISCYGSYLDDTTESILYTVSEVGIMSKYGGGTSGYFGAIRGRGEPIKDNGQTDGSVNFMRLFDTVVDMISQGATRRGSMAIYLPIDHKDIMEFLEIKSEGNPIQELFFAVTVKDYWLKEMIAGDYNKRKIWARVLQKRNELGLPYILFHDNVNNNKPQVYKDNGMEIYASNLCAEISLPSNTEESFVCDLSSMNLLHFDEWYKTDAVIVLTQFLDAVMTDFINKAKKIPFLKRAIKFSERHRALGVGVLGWHSYLQSKMIPFDSLEAMSINNKIFKYIQEEAEAATEDLFNKKGTSDLLFNYNRRNSTLTAIAPTTSSAFILGQVSQSIEPIRSNYYVRDLAKLKVTYKNTYLDSLLESKGKNNSDVWNSILLYNGSVSHLDFLNDEEKDVFKTFSEISQLSIIQQAAQRQKYIDQSQSLNLMVHPETPTKDINKLYLTAWELGVKSLYYQHSVNAAQEFNRELLTCSVCEG